MHAHLKDPAKMMHLMTKCSEAMAACMMCMEHAHEMQMDCYKVLILIPLLILISSSS